MTITPHQLHLLHHTLGLRPDRRDPWRNYFLAGEGHHDQPDLEALEDAGLMRRQGAPAFCEPGDVVFVCTNAGKAYAIEHLPEPPPPPPPSNYRDWIEADSGHSFSEWLGINKPFFECRFERGKWEYLMRRGDRYYTWGAWGAVSGDWKPTKQEAKASYKAALKAFNDRRRASHV